ncbi:MAG: ribose transport system substrate-binding protein [Nocardioides sp.]|jgi:ribose transport system substrate-binding protein|uniref:sugar ABC transporter substrate-binding protein n=1 Tax=Nocardioides sp. TaxID=35761 RepID=UPI00261454E6|nr:sugar ABC transporter substrate-binding protein [Nocardioides sp.]MCW2833528.1 ribose transport system substrate-binding protein [Nocardioides sp.]
MKKVTRRIAMRPARLRVVSLFAALLVVVLVGSGCTTATEQSAGSDSEVSDSELVPEAAAAKEVAEGLMTSEATWQGPASAPAPQAGQRVAVVSCCQASEGAARPTAAIQEASKAIGWTATVFDGKGDPTEQNKAINAAVDADFDAIALVFVDTTTVSESLQRALAADIPVITLGALRNTPDSIPDVSHDWVGYGEQLANYMIWKSNGSVDALMLNNTDLLIAYGGQLKGSEEVLGDPSLCPDCNMEKKDWSLANLDTQPAELATAALQANPDINWVWCFDACMSRVSRALTASGTTTADVRGAGFDCNGENLQLIQENKIQVVCAADPRDWEGYAVVDNLNRMLQGEEAVDQKIPTKMFDASNIDTLSDEELKSGWQGDIDFRSEYAKLWGLS